MNISKLFFFLILISFCLIKFVNAAGIQEDVPFISSEYTYKFYSTYSLLIDLFVYTLLFIGISQATLGKHFPSRGGKAVSVALGLALAIGLVTSEKALGFNLRSF